jgi:hypothetical protein
MLEKCKFSCCWAPLIAAGVMCTYLCFVVWYSICGDPTCAPIDTVVTLVWESGGKGMFGIPLAPLEVKQEDLLDLFPVRSLSLLLSRCSGFM